MYKYFPRMSIVVHFHCGISTRKTIGSVFMNNISGRVSVFYNLCDNNNTNNNNNININNHN